jgi:iron-sulfur cluster assembly protein
MEWMNSVTVRLDQGQVLLDRLLLEGVSVAHECGGKLACSTCRVVVQEGMECLSTMSEDELDMLDRASVDAPGARLACQAVSSGGEVVVIFPESTVPARVAGSSPVSVSERAAAFLAAQLARHPGAQAIRLAVEPAGCSGLRYRLDPAGAIRAEDSIFESKGLRLAVDPLSLPHVQGTTIELVREGLAQRLRFDNPNARQSCGCGESFGT